MQLDYIDHIFHCFVLAKIIQKSTVRIDQINDDRMIDDVIVIFVSSAFAVINAERSANFFYLKYQNFSLKDPICFLFSISVFNLKPEDYLNISLDFLANQAIMQVLVRRIFLRLYIEKSIQFKINFRKSKKFEIFGNIIYFSFNRGPEKCFKATHD